MSEVNHHQEEVDTYGSIDSDSYRCFCIMLPSL